MDGISINQYSIISLNITRTKRCHKVWHLWHLWHQVWPLVWHPGQFPLETRQSTATGYKGHMGRLRAHLFMILSDFLGFFQIITPTPFPRGVCVCKRKDIFK